MENNMIYHEKLYRVWGEYLRYPQCCVDDFIDRTLFKGELAPTYMKDSPFYQSGYIPCKCCHDKTKYMTDEEAFKWLGRNPFDGIVGPYYNFQGALNKVNTESFQFIACKYGFDVVEYGLWLERQLEQLEGL